MNTIGELQDRVMVRGLQPDDLERVIALDAKIVGRRRDEYFKLKLKENLADTGIKVSLDDFGAGYSSMGQIRDLPFDKIKIFMHEQINGEIVISIHCQLMIFYQKL